MNLNGQKPFLRWAGGKSWLLNTLATIVPEGFQNYHEPFLGGGSVFFNLNPQKSSFLSDTNDALINTYIQIRDNLEDVISILRGYKNNPEDYYRIRATKYPDKIQKAAKFIYLNRTGFNGIYRVNLAGEYNVPYGHKKYQTLFDFDILRTAQMTLRNASLSSCDFEDGKEKITQQDLIFLDPPYTHSEIKNGFIKYNERLFSWHDQERLARHIEWIRDRGAYYILTNAKHPTVKELYGKVDKPIVVNRFSRVGGKNAKRKVIQEYIFTNITLESGKGF